MMTDREFAEETYASDALMDEEQDEPNSALKEWALKCHEIMDRIERDQMLLRISLQNLVEDTEDHDHKGPQCNHPSHNQI